MSYNDQDPSFHNRGGTFARGQYQAGPLVNADATLSPIDAGFTFWHSYTNNLGVKDWARTVEDASIGTIDESTCRNSIGPYMYFPSGGSFRIHNVSVGAGWLAGTVALRGTNWPLFFGYLAFGYVRKKRPAISFGSTSNTTASGGNQDVGGITTYPPAGPLSRTYNLRFHCGMISCNTGVGPDALDITFGPNVAGAIQGHPLSAGQTLLIPPGVLTSGVLDSRIRAAGGATTTQTTSTH